MNVEAICPLCYHSHIVPASQRGKRCRCEGCEEEFLVNLRAKETNKKPPRPPTVEAVDAPVEADVVEEPPPKAGGKSASKPAPKRRPAGDDEEVIDADVVDEAGDRRQGKGSPPDDALQTSRGRLRSTPPAKSTRTKADRDDGDNRVEDEEDDEPARKRRKVPRSGEVPTGKIIAAVGGALAILALLAGGAWWLLSRSSAPPSPTPPPAPPAFANVPPAANPRTPFAPPPAPPVQANPPAPVIPPANPPAPAPRTPRTPRPGTTKPAAPPVAWSVKADPALAPVKVAAPPAAGAIRILDPGTDVVVYPAVPSPFVAIGRNITLNQERQVWNLATGQQTGRLRGVPNTNEPLSLSPDGAYFAGAAPSPASTVTLITVATGESRPITVNDSPAFIDLVLFPAPGKLLTASRGTGSAKVFKLWDAASGALEKTIDGPNLLDKDAAVLSPGGRYLAISDTDRVYAYDLQSGQSAGDLPLPRDNAFAAWFCRGLAFSPSGAELAGLFEIGADTRLVVWDAVGGNVLQEHKFPGHFKTSINNAIFYRGPKLEWLPDGSGWLVHGSRWVERKTGAVKATLPFDDPMPAARHIVGSAHVAVPRGPTGSRTMTLEPIPFDKLRP